MPDLGVIGIKGLLTTRLQGQVKTGTARVIMIGAQPLYLFNRRDDALGNPSPPSQRQGPLHTLRDIYWPVAAGFRTFAIDVRFHGMQSGTLKPRVHVKANPQVGLNADAVLMPSVGVDAWETLTFSFTATATGVLSVWREVQDYSADAQANWDNIVVN